MNIRELDGQNICILGFGREGEATLRALQHFSPQARITIADRRPIESTIPVVSGENYLDNLGQFDVIIKTPGLAWDPPAPLSSRVTNATQIFLDSLPPQATTIGVTGTKGKSSTAHLIHQVLRRHVERTFLAGNIGTPMLDLLTDGQPTDIYVLELSSYQLQDLRTSPHIAVLTSLAPDHIDHHGNLEAYFEAKSHITQFQHPDDMVFYNAESAACRRMAERSPGKHIGFGSSDLPPALQEHLPSNTVASNVAAAFEVARQFNMRQEEIIKALRAAAGLPHRRQNLGIHHGIIWIDDSAATTPQATQTAVSDLDPNIGAIIVGGLNRDYDFSGLGITIADSAIDTIILMPDTGALVKQAIEHAQPNRPITFHNAASMPQAVAYAAKHTKPGTICLLSSGAPSYNLYKNFNERGEAFAKAIAALSD